MGIDVLSTGPTKLADPNSKIEFKPVSSTKKSEIFFSMEPRQEYFFNYNKIKDGVYLEAISNLMKKNEFLQLLIQMLQDQITEEEYEQELRNNREKYFIELKPIESPEYYNVIINICKNLKGSITPDEISEIFGIKQGDLITAIEE